MARISNGKLIDGNFHSGAEIMNKMPSGRRAVELGFKRVKNIDPRKNYSPDEIMRIREIPDRCKGGYFKQRPEYSKAMIREQIVQISSKLFKGATGIDFDDDNYDWMVIEKYVLPPTWPVRTCPLMLILPTEYPEIPPVGFYLPNTIQSPNGHVYSQAYHNASSAPLQKGWNWYCAYIKPGSWNPAHRLGGYGDSLWDYITLIGEVLASGDN